MRILCLSDIHGLGNLISEAVAQTNPPPDIVVVCGDWTTFGNVASLAPIANTLAKAGIPFLGVSGNCDSAEIENFLSAKDISIDGRGRMKGELGFFGVSASNTTPLFTPFERSEQEILSLLAIGYESVRHAKKKILVCHVPPFNTTTDLLRGGTHAGSRSIRSFIETNSVDLVLCGHIHESFGLDQIGNTHVVNAGALAQGRFAIIEIESEIQVDLRVL